MKTLIAATLLLTALFTATAQAVVITYGNATVYGNPFTGSTNTYGVIADGTTQGFSIDNVVSQQDASNANPVSAGRIQGTDTSGFMQFQAAVPFTAGTVISAKNTGNFNAAQPFTIKLDGTPVQSGPGNINTAPIQVTTLPVAQTVQTLRVELGMSTFGGNTTTHYADMNEVLILPDRLAPVAATAAATSTYQPAYSASNLVDSDGSQVWLGTSDTDSVTLTFSGTKPIAALVLANTEGYPASFDIYNNADTKVASVSMSANSGAGEFVGIHFNTPVITSSLKFTFTNTNTVTFPNDLATMREIIPLEAPEPASMGLLAVGGVMLLKRRRAGGC